MRLQLGSSFARGAMVLFVVCLFATGCGGTTDEELSRRIAEADPGWDDYEEDIKAMIGPAEVAEWQGEPVRAWRDGNIVKVEFALRGSWAQRPFAIPILLRDPALSVHRHTDAEWDAGHLTYTFELESASPRALPWVEVAYPHHIRRIPVAQEAPGS
jgi:hypothetical protein